MKKRILSLILALSMMLSVLPLGAFAAGSTQDLVMQGGFPDCSGGTSGNGWSYDNNTQTLTLTSGSYDFNYTNPKTPAGMPTNRAVQCAVMTQSGVTITGGTFNGGVFNSGTITKRAITDSTFNGVVTNNAGGTISGGTFNATVTNNAGGKISGGAFQSTGSVTNYGTINGNGTFAGKVTNYTGVTLPGGTISGGTFYGSVTNLNTIEKGTFEGNVTNSGTISGGTFQSKCSVENYSYIENGTFEGSVTNYSTIENGTFNGTVTNEGANATIKNGTFNVDVTNSGTITGNGTFNGTVTNNAGGTISGGTFNGDVINFEKISDGTFEKLVTNYSDIEKGTFKGEVKNHNGTISGGKFEGTVINDVNGTISDGTFNKEVSNINGNISNGTFNKTVKNDAGGTISGGTFAAGLSDNDGSVTGGAFNGKTGLTTKAHQVTVTNGSVSQVNGVDPRNADGTTGTAWDLYAYKGTTVIITADTEIFSLNGYPISGAYNSSYPYTNNKKIVKFTMPYNENVVLSTGELVMAGGYPIGSNNGANNYNGKGWAYSAGNLSDPTDTGTLHLWSGTFDFNFADPTTKITRTDSAVACEIQSYATIIGGIFAGSVKNGYTIENGTFTNKVENSGYINNGTFAGNVTNSGAVNGGVFNRNATLINVTGGHNITWDAAYSNANIVAVNDVSANWKPYAYAGTTMTITASTEIFSLNGRLLGEGDHVNGNKNTVKFTMPDDKDVVLNGAIASTDLVMEGGWPKDSNGGTIPCSGTGWSYDHNTKTLTLTIGSGSYDFGYTNPKTNAGGSTNQAVKCAIVIQPWVEITGGTFADSVTSKGTIKDGTFEGEVTNNDGTISGGTFNGTVTNNTNGTISGGTFKGDVKNNDGTIHGGTFAGSVENKWNIYGGVFNGNKNPTGITGYLSITVASGAKITEVNGVSLDGSAVWDPYVVVTSDATTNEVTITASTEIFSLNGQPIGAGNCNSSYPDENDKATVTFTMPDKDVVLNEKINYGDLVMENGYPKASNGGTIPCKGDGWEYIKNDPTNGDMLLLTGNSQTGGLYDFSAIGDGSPVECKVFVGKPTAITGGEFNGTVFNNSGILGGTFHGEVDNMGPGTIEKGTFNGAVENNGTIENGTFNDSVENNGMIENGAFHKAVENNGTINDGTFNGAVENNGTINGGTFNGAVTGSGTVSESITGSGTLNGEPITKTPEPEPTTYTVTVIGGTIDGKTSVSAKENDTLTVVLDQNDIPDGMTFDMWSISSSKLSGDINVDYRAEAMTFQMPAEDVTIRAQYRSAEIIEDAAPSPLATAATIAVGGAAAGIMVWQGVSLGVDLYLTSALPQGVPVPTDRRALALLLWETAGKPEVALPTLYGDIPTEEIELQKATRWAVQNGLMDAADKKDASFFDPDHYVTKMDVFGAWLRLKKLLGTT